jgi:tetratricopeptide (TPR) repeat protein
METAQRKIFSRQFKEAIDLLTSCIQHYQPLPPKCPFYATLYTQRAEAHLRVKQYKEALKDCALVLYAQEDHIPAWLIRFQAHHGLEDHATALEEVKEVCRKFNLEQDHRLRQAYERNQKGLQEKSLAAASRQIAARIIRRRTKTRSTEISTVGRRFGNFV